MLLEFHIGTMLQKQSVDLRLKKLFQIEENVKGNNKKYSSKIWDGVIDGEGAGSYLFHEDDYTDEDILANKGYGSETIDKLKAINKKVKEVVAINKQKASTKLVDKAVLHFKDKSFDRLKILKYMLSCIQKGENYHPGHRLKSFVEEVEIKLTDEIDLDCLSIQYYNLMWRN